MPHIVLIENQILQVRAQEFEVLIVQDLFV